CELGYVTVFDLWSYRLTRALHPLQSNVLSISWNLTGTKLVCADENDTVLIDISQDVPVTLKESDIVNAGRAYNGEPVSKPSPGVVEGKDMEPPSEATMRAVRRILRQPWSALKKREELDKALSNFSKDAQRPILEVLSEAHVIAPDGNDPDTVCLSQMYTSGDGEWRKREIARITYTEGRTAASVSSLALSDGSVIIAVAYTQGGIDVFHAGSKMEGEGENVGYYHVGSEASVPSATVKVSVLSVLETPFVVVCTGTVLKAHKLVSQSIVETSASSPQGPYILDTQGTDGTDIGGCLRRDESVLQMHVQSVQREQWLACVTARQVIVISLDPSNSQPLSLVLAIPAQTRVPGMDASFTVARVPTPMHDIPTPVPISEPDVPKGLHVVYLTGESLSLIDIEVVRTLRTLRSQSIDRPLNGLVQDTVVQGERPMNKAVSGRETVIVPTVAMCYGKNALVVFMPGLPIPPLHALVPGLRFTARPVGKEEREDEFDDVPCMKTYDDPRYLDRVGAREYVGDDPDDELDLGVPGECTGVTEELSVVPGLWRSEIGVRDHLRVPY
ncbi:hypothetical protein KIPB_004405, partial [Kipferlia bialata]